MRIIKEKTLIESCKLPKYKHADSSVKSWIYEVRYSEWNNAQELKQKYGTASILTSKRLVFNIKGNEFRLIVDIEFKINVVFVVWLGSHSEYNQIDAKTIRYED